MKYNEIAPLWLEKATEEAYDLLLTLAQIPAPSGMEERRAAFCHDWLLKAGAEGVYIDQAKNVIYPIGDRGDNPPGGGHGPQRRGLSRPGTSAPAGGGWQNLLSRGGG